MSSLWIYVLGERSGEDVKVGWTADQTIRTRLGTVNGDQTTNADYELLAAVRGERKDETSIKDYFAAIRRHDKGRRTEYFYPEPEIVEYAAWLRSQWFATVDVDEKRDDASAQDPSHWIPTPARRLSKPPDDPTRLVQPYMTASGALPGPWAWFPNPKASFQDYFTPAEIVEAAREAMGGIDLDAASHWAANRVHKIPAYFDATRSAFDYEWHGRVWLNPPYSNNKPWFDRALEFIRSGAVEQMCMLSPVWAFTTAIAADFMRTSAAMVLLSPTPKFWGNEQGRTGKNHPHAIVYLGDRVVEFQQAFSFDNNIFLRADVFALSEEGVACGSAQTEM